MGPESLMPKRLTKYLHDVGVRALDHAVSTVKPDSPSAVNALADHWRAMSADDKQHFVDRVASSAIDMIAASVLIPVGIKVGKKAAKSAAKVIKRRRKALKKDAKLTKSSLKAAKKASKKAATA